MVRKGQTGGIPVVFGSCASLSQTNRVCHTGSSCGKWTLYKSPAEPGVFAMGKSQNFSEIFGGGMNKYGQRLFHGILLN